MANFNTLSDASIATKIMNVQRVVRGILLRDNKAFVVLRRQDRLDGGLWEFPGGKVEAYESPVDALAREFLEETGIEIHVGEVVDEHWWSSPQERVTFYCAMAFALLSNIKAKANARLTAPMSGIIMESPRLEQMCGERIW